MLKPHVDLINDPPHWRGDIGLNFTEAMWQQWFDSYNTMLVHYAELAQQVKVEQFSLGCELITTCKFPLGIDGSLTNSFNTSCSRQRMEKSSFQCKKCILWQFDLCSELGKQLVRKEFYSLN
jgi:hypothetical protein